MPRQRSDFRAYVTQARAEARALGSGRIEAEHLLLALAARPDTAAGRLLAAAGLDHRGVDEALDKEFERSLNAVGVWLPAYLLPGRSLPIVGEPRLAQSAKLAFRRGLMARTGPGRERRFNSLHLLVGVLEADGGTVARALAAAEVDRAALVAHAKAALTQTA